MIGSEHGTMIEHRSTDESESYVSLSCASSEMSVASELKLARGQIGQIVISVHCFKSCFKSRQKD